MKEASTERNSARKKPGGTRSPGGPNGLQYRAVQIAAATREPFDRLLAAGVAAQLAVEATVNLGMTVGLLPVRGLSLPMVSYGGSGLLAHGVALGLLLSVGARPGYEVTAEPFRYAASG